MCSAADDPTQYDIPEPQPPRVYRLAGDAPVEEPHGSVALAVLGEMLMEAERASDWHNPAASRARITTLREARDRVAEAKG